MSSCQRRLKFEAGANTHPAFCKEPRYAYQDEVRVIWKAKGGKFTPVIFDCPSAAQYCSAYPLTL